MNRPWETPYKEGDIQPWDQRPYRETLHYRGIRFAGAGNKCKDSVEIIEGYNYNGSGKDSFGGADKWPHVTVRVALPEGRNDLREILAKRLATEIDRFIDEHDLNPKVED